MRAKPLLLLFLPLSLHVLACSGESSGDGAAHDDAGAAASDGGAGSSPSTSGEGTDGGGPSDAAAPSDGSTSISPDGGAAACAAAFATLCDRAWTCGQDASRLAFSADAGASTASWDTADGCKGFWAYGCYTPGDVRPDFDPAACSAAAAQSACISTGQGPALVYPAACYVNDATH